MTLCDLLEMRDRQNELKLNYINALRNFDKSELFDSSLQSKVFAAKKLLLDFESTLPGNDGRISSIDFDSTNRNHR